jgi:hypothetical protein
MSIIGPTFPTATEFPQELIQKEAQRVGEIREAQKITRILRDIVDPDSIPLTDVNRVQLQSIKKANRDAENNISTMKSNDQRYNAYVARFKKDMDDFMRPFNAPLTNPDSAVKTFTK